MADSINMSLDEIIKQNKQNQVRRSRGRGGATRGRGGRGGRGGGRGRGRGTTRGRSRSRPGTPGPRQGRSHSRGPRGRSQSRTRSQSRGRSQSRNRSRSRQYRANSRGRSASRSRQGRALTPKLRAGLEAQVGDGSFNRGGIRSRLRHTNSNPQNSIHSRLGVTTRRGAANNLNRPLAVAKRGISKRGRGMATNNRYSSVGLRSDQILKEQCKNLILQNNIIKSQTFRRSRNNSFSSPSQLTVRVANDFARRRRNSVGNAGYLNKQSLDQLTNQFGGYNTRRGPGSVKSLASSKSNRSSYSNRSNASNRSMRSRGRGRGGNRGVGRKFVNKQILNPKLQKEIAAIQGKTYGSNNSISEAAPGVNFIPTPTATGQTLHQRFAST